MARKKTAAKRTPGRASNGEGRADSRSGSTSARNPGTIEDHIIDAALAEAAAAGWSDLTMDGIAARADIALGEVLSHVPTRAHVVARFLKRLDARMLAGVKGLDPADSPRDRLFDVVMRRFDLLDKNREGVRAIVQGLWRDPLAAAMTACRVERSAALILGAAGISADGLRGWLRVQGLKAVLAQALRAWMDDDTDDMAKTMAALDRALDLVERLLSFSRMRRRRSENAEAE